MKYTEVTFKLEPINVVRDLLVDTLGNEGPYDSFVETTDGLKAYVPSNLFDTDWLEERVTDLRNLSQITYSYQEMPDKNWNEEWEKQHQPVLVVNDGKPAVWVRAPFHEHRPDVEYEIEIEPKMSFGTAHHPTTYMMLSYLTEIAIEGKRVLDMGCGTAVLAILAKMRGASYVEAIDIDEWAYNNAVENACRNGADITVRIGDADLLRHRENDTMLFDIVIANINRNILLHDMDAYASVLGDGGILLLSGFYENDSTALVQKAKEFGINPKGMKCREGWCAIQLGR